MTIYEFMSIQSDSPKFTSPVANTLTVMRAATIIESNGDRMDRIYFPAKVYDSFVKSLNGVASREVHERGEFMGAKMMVNPDLEDPIITVQGRKESPFSVVRIYIGSAGE